MINVLIRSDFPASVIEQFRAIPEIELIADDYSRFKSEIIISTTQPVEAIITDQRTPYHSSWDEALPGLKLVVQIGLPPSFDQVNVLSRSGGVECQYTVEAGTISVAEMTLAGMISLSRCRAWQNGDVDSEPVAMELSSKTLGIIGFGRIGRAVANLAQAFGMAVVFYDIKEMEGAPFARMVSLRELLSTSDYISVHAPLNSQTHHFIGRDSFCLVRKGAFLVDMSQEGLVDVQAMKQALDDGLLSGVLADVYSPKRQKELGLERYNTCIWLPIRSAFTLETHARAGMEAVRIVKEYFNV